MMKTLLPLVALLASLSLPAFAAESASHADLAINHEAREKDLEMRARLQQRIDEFTNDEQSKARLMHAAKRRIALCKTCHGEDGNALVENVPSLAGQNPVYLVDQFMRFGDGRRNDFTMSSLAKVINDEDKIKLAIYFSEQELKPAGGGQPELMERGKQRYEILCMECHGADGLGGEKGYARLAGQRPEYIVKMLKEFKNQTGRRSNPWMSARANALTDSDMLAVATYLANLH